uniref:non-ribosomal peptide synthetase n=1 Tax=Oceanicella sp. SM1341 TaxID=1548889 RepID=UPI000E4C6A1F
MTEVLDLFEMTPLQAGMLFHSLHEPEKAAYFEQYHCVLEGPLDAAAFRAAWDRVIARHDVLRSACHWEGLEHPAQVIYATAAPEWHIAEGGEGPDLERWLAEDRARGFALDAPPLMRFALLRMGAERHRFVWSFHHLLMDGWCGGLLVQEVLTLLAGRTLPPPPPPWRDYIDWRERRQDGAETQAYWRRTLAGLEGPTPAGVERGASAEERGASGIADLHCRLGPALSARLTALARAERLTLATLMQGAWALLLARQSGKRDVVFGAVQAGRPPELEGAERMIGLFLNTVPLRVDTDPARPLGDWLRALQAGQRDRERFGHAALTDIRRWAGLPAGPLFESLLVVETYPLGMEAAAAASGSALTVSEPSTFERTMAPLSLKVLPGEDIALNLTIETDRVSRAGAEGLLARLRALLSAFCDTPQAALGSLGGPEPGEAARLLAAGQGPAPEGTPEPVHLQVLAQARAHPQATALEFEAADGRTESLTYAELTARAGALAAALGARGIGRGDVVALCLPRGAALPVAMLGVLHSGAAYLPLDPLYPAERIAHVLGDAGASLLLTAPGAAPEAPGCPVLDVTGIAPAEAPPPVACAPDALAYMLYTSGSTGRPKGVPIPHGALSNFLRAMAARPGLAPGERLLAVTTVAFDISGLELLGPLATGGTVLLAEAETTRDPMLLADHIARRAPDVMQATPAGWRMLVEAGWEGRPGLRMLCGGEALDGALARDLLARGGALWNLYGPTETTIWSAALRVTPELAQGATVPVGGPLDHTLLAVLDAEGRLAAPGTAGELCIGGAGLSPGYHRRPALAAAAFMPNPFGPGRLYRTGDAVRLREDGLLDFLGRIDGQVKLRGHRIEPGEIEARLAEHPAVRQAVAVVRDDGAGPALVAYLRWEEGAAPVPPAELRARLAAALPAYMLPSALVPLEAFPLTPNGKIDRRALPAPPRGGQGADRAAPLLVSLVGALWAQVLGREAVGPQEDFFDLGGHSLLATRLLGAVREATGIEAGLRDLFEAPTLGAFCDRLEAARGAPALPPVIPAEGAHQLSFAQERQWLLDRLEPGNPVYLMPAAVSLTGRLDIAALEAALTGLAARHEVFRTAFPAGPEGAPAPRLHPAAPVRLAVEDLSAAAAPQAALDAARRAEAQTGFDLAAAPPWRARLLRLGPARHVLLLTMHHILADEWSLELILGDIAAGYRAALVGAPPPPGPALRYADFAAWQRGLDLAPQAAHWRERLAGAPALLPLPGDRPRPETRSGAGGAVPLQLSAETTAALGRLARGQGVTLFICLLAGFTAFLHRVTGSSDIVVGTPVANRRQAELQQLVGLFVNTLPIRSDLSDDPGFDRLLARTRDALLDAHAHQDLPFEQMLTLAEAPRSRSHAPLVQALFALQTLPEAGSLAPGLDWAPLPAVALTAKVDLSLALRETPEGLRGSLEYAADVFGRAEAERLAALLETLLGHLAEAAERRLSELPLAGPEALACTAAPAAAPGPWLPAVLEAQAAEAPGAEVLPGLDRAGLRARVRARAAALAASGIGRGTCVALPMTRDAETIVTLLALLRLRAPALLLEPGAAVPPLARALPRPGGPGDEAPPRPGPAPSPGTAAGTPANLPASAAGRGETPARPEQAPSDPPPAPAVSPPHPEETVLMLMTPEGPVALPARATGAAAAFAEGGTVLLPGALASPAGVFALLAGLAGGARLRLDPDGADTGPWWAVVADAGDASRLAAWPAAAAGP